jgi:hypothetical protein
MIFLTLLLQNHQCSEVDSILDEFEPVSHFEMLEKVATLLQE